MEGQLPSAFFTGNLPVGYSNRRRTLKIGTSQKSRLKWNTIHFYLGVSQPRRIVIAVLRLRNTLTYLLTMLKIAIISFRRHFEESDIAEFLLGT